MSGARSRGLPGGAAPHAGDEPPRDELCERACPDTRHVSGRTLDSHVRRIRAKFLEQGLDPIDTVHGVGYRFEIPPA